MKKLLLSLGLLATLCVLGCGPGRQKEESVDIKIQINPLDQVKNTLERYVKGEPMGSEAMQFEDLVKNVKTADAAKGDILEKGLEDLKKANKAQLPGKAKELMGKLGLK